MRAWLAIGCALLAAGCATSEIKVYVDIYDEDPRFIAPMPPEEVAGLIANLERLRAAAKDKTAQRKYLADTSVELYLNTWYEIAGGRETDAAVELTDGLNGKKTTYDDTADEAFGEFESLVDDAIALLEGYVIQYRINYKTAYAEFQACENERLQGKSKAPPAGAGTGSSCWLTEKAKDDVERLDDEWVVRRLPVELRELEANARASIAKAVAGYRGFAAPLKDSFVLDWAGLRSIIYNLRENSTTNKARENNAKRALHGLNMRLASIAQATNLVPQSKIDEAVDNDARSGFTGLFDSTIKIAIELESLRADLPDDVTAQTALSGLVQNAARFAELIDRLQDAGDPVWRIVTSEDNEGHWNNEIALTRFYAEGKSNVVIVRQDAMRYDIHEGTNNPAALIKGQLEVSRAIANAAINVVGAASGIKVPGEGTKPGTPASDDAAAVKSDQAAAEAFAQRKAKAEEDERARQNALRGLSMELNNILMNLATNGNSPEALAAQRTRLAAILKAYKSLFEISGT